MVVCDELVNKTFDYYTLYQSIRASVREKETNQRNLKTLRSPVKVSVLFCPDSRWLSLDLELWE